MSIQLKTGEVKQPSLSKISIEVNDIEHQMSKYTLSYDGDGSGDSGGDGGGSGDSGDGDGSGGDGGGGSGDGGDSDSP